MEEKQYKRGNRSCHITMRTAMEKNKEIIRPRPLRLQKYLILQIKSVEEFIKCSSVETLNKIISLRKFVSQSFHVLKQCMREFKWSIIIIL